MYKITFILLISTFIKIYAYKISYKLSPDDLSSCRQYATSLDKYRTFYKLSDYNEITDENQVVNFRVMIGGERDGHVFFATSGNPNTATDPGYEIVLGSWGNTKSFIRRGDNREELIEIATPDVIPLHELLSLTITITKDGNITVIKENTATIVASARDANLLPITHISFRSASFAEVEYIFGCPPIKQMVHKKLVNLSGKSNAFEIAFRSTDDNYRMHFRLSEKH